MLVRKITLIVFFIAISTSLFASDKNILLRLERVERMMQNNSQLKVLSKIKSLQQENQELRSVLEELVFKHDKLKNRLQSLNEDMDRRVLSLESDVLEQKSAEDIQKQPELLENIDNKENEIDNSLEEQNTEQNLIEQKVYQAAFNELKALRYGKAEKSFKEFLQQYPESNYAQLAQYWLAESSYAQRNFKQSIKHYSDLLTKYKNSPKFIEANLKIAYCYYELADYKTAKIKLNHLIKNYPDSTETGQAKRLLK
ncbi:MAG: tol-pal system protein YbgF, partial [Pseudomonadota bacterium]